jgi:AcrR family transcriptional regulator
MANPPVTLRAQAKARTRRTILATAKGLFERAGYEAATIREIASAAGYSTGAVFANFKDKTELYEAIYGHPPITPEQGRAYLLELQALTTGKAA